MYANMKLQDFFPFDSAIVGMENLYSEVGEDSFLVNSNCVVAKAKILTKGKHYIVFDIPTKTDIKMTEIVLIDLFFYESSINLISQDINTQKVSIIHFSISSPTSDCTRYLVDIDYFIDRMNERAIRDYCGCDNKKKPIGQGKTKFTEDLLEFEF